MTQPGLVSRRAARPRPIVGAIAILALAAGAASCNLDLENPNSPTETEVVGDIDGIIALAVGMQAQFAFTIDDYLATSSLVTDEWGTRSLALVSYISLFTGQNFDNSFDVVADPFARSYQTIKSANRVLENADAVGLGPALKAGIVSLAQLFKAMSLGMLISQYESVPIDISVSDPQPKPRAEVLDTVLTLLEAARTGIEPVSDVDLAGFRQRVLGTGIDLRNTINAMLARYYLMDGQYANAITAADRVNLGVLSTLTYPSPTRNPVENLAFQLRYVAGLKSFVDQAQPGDQRPAYWLDLVTAPPAANPPDSILRFLKKYSTANEPFPLYLPDEMRLIKAEALTMLGQYTEAATLVNDVHTQTTSPVNEPIAGFLTPIPLTSLDTESELLDAIAYERRYELFEQGLRWEDTRRLGTARTTTPTMTFLPLPRSECLTNPSAGCGT
jgi:hypothetical protein